MSEKLAQEIRLALVPLIRELFLLAEREQAANFLQRAFLRVDEKGDEIVAKMDRLIAEKIAASPSPVMGMTPVAWLKDAQPDAEDEALVTCYKGDKGAFPVFADPNHQTGGMGERDRAAKIADEIAARPPSAPSGRHDDWQHGFQDGAMEVAAAIRAMKGGGTQ